MNNFSVTELWGMVSSQTKEEKKAAEYRHAAALKGVQGEIIAHASTIRLTYEAEDEKCPATMPELMVAVNTARTEELEAFLQAKNKTLPFEDGYLIVHF